MHKKSNILVHIVTLTLITTLGIIASGVSAACSHPNNPLEHAVHAIAKSVLCVPRTYSTSKIVSTLPIPSTSNQNKVITMLSNVGQVCVNIICNLVFFIPTFYATKYGTLALGCTGSQFAHTTLIRQLLDNFITLCTFSLAKNLSKIILPPSPATHSPIDDKA